MDKKVFQWQYHDCMIILSWSILLEIKKYGCKFVISWTDKNVCVFLTLTKTRFETKNNIKLQNYSLKNIGINKNVWLNRFWLNVSILIKESIVMQAMQV